MQAPIGTDQLRRLLAERAPVVRQALHRASVALVLYGQSQIETLLLIRRAENPNDPWSGHISLPGGHRAAEDRDELATTLRETREEVGLNLDPTRSLVGRLDDVIAVANGQPLDLSISPFVFTIDHLPELRANSEVTEILWVPLEPLFSGAASTQIEVQIGPGTRLLPAWRVGRYLVWGLTYRMIKMLFSRMRLAR